MMQPTMATCLARICPDSSSSLLSNIAPHNYTVADAVREWLQYGLSGRNPKTIEKCTILANMHIIPALGARKLRDLSADDVDQWLVEKARSLSTRTLREIMSVLKRAITRAQARDKVKRNVVLLCEIPQGSTGRPSKSLTLPQAEALLEAAARSAMYAYVVLSLLIGARTEELRALTWSLVDLDGTPASAGTPAMPPSIMVWRSVRAGGDTKTQAITADARAPAAMRGCPARALDAPGWPETAGWQPVAGQRSCVPLPSRHAMGCIARPPRVPQGGRGGRARPLGVDSEGTAAQLRLADVRCWRSGRANRPARWPQRDRDNRGRLPQADPACSHRGRGRHGPYLPAR